MDFPLIELFLGNLVSRFQRHSTVAHHLFPSLRRVFDIG